MQDAGHADILFVFTKPISKADNMHTIIFKNKIQEH